MIKPYLVALLLLMGSAAIAQNNNAEYLAKEFSEEESFYRAKEFVMNDVLGAKEKITHFTLDHLAVAKSEELSSLVYHSSDRNQSGLVLGFYGTRMSEAGEIYNSYGFRALPEDSARKILTRLNQVLENEKKFLRSDKDNNNLFFTYKDITFLVYRDGRTKIRVFWNGYDSEWESSSLERTIKRFEKKLKNF